MSTSCLEYDLNGKFVLGIGLYRVYYGMCPNDRIALLSLLDGDENANYFLADINNTELLQPDRQYLPKRHIS